MNPTRRTVIAASLSAFASCGVAHAAVGDPRTSDRAIGSPDAKVVVQEYFSLTCTHCAAFQKETFPRVKAELIDTGRIRYVWRDFPLDQLALMAAMAARTLPSDRYEPFATALLGTQDRWAFNRSADPVEELAKLAMLAGMPRATFDASVRDEGLRQFVLGEQALGMKRYDVKATPTFVVGEKSVTGAIPFEAFLKAVEAAGV